MKIKKRVKKCSWCNELYFYTIAPWHKIGCCSKGCYDIQASIDAYIDISLEKSERKFLERFETW